MAARPPSEAHAILAEIRGLKGSLDRLEDKATRHGARLDEAVRHIAEQGAQIETLAGSLEVADDRARGSRSEMIGMLQRGNVEVREEMRRELSEVKARSEALEARVGNLAPRVESKAETGAERGAEKSKPSLKGRAVEVASIAGGSGLMSVVLTHPAETLRWIKWAAGIVAGSHVPGVD